MALIISAEPTPEPPDRGSTTTTPVRLALEVENGAGAPVRVRAGQTFYVAQIDVRTVVTSDRDRGVATLAERGDFADLAWGGTRASDEDFLILPNPDGTFTRRRFYRDAAWMVRDSSLVVEQLDASGEPLDAPVTVRTGLEHTRRQSDDFFVRRLRAIQWTLDCATRTDCSGARRFEEEALVELRYAERQAPLLRIHEQTRALRLSWSQLDHAWTIPVTQVASPAWDYGFRIDLEPVGTPPGGVHAPGDEVAVRVALRDGSGARLHPEGSLPTYEEVVFGPNPAGIQYYRAFFDPSITWWRRKHRERMLMATMIGPAQRVGPIRTVLELESFLGPDDVQDVGTFARDGVFAQFATIPPANDLFGGAFDPTHAGWRAPVSDVVRFRLPPDAEPGTYLITVKGRRVYLGEDVPFARTIEVQVGSAEPTTATLPTGRCQTCHQEGSALSLVLHGTSDRRTCHGCHAPLAFELDTPIAVRVHYLHSRSRRFAAPPAQCATCHLEAASITRTSQAACLSCHQSYPRDHVERYGPIESPFVGGGRDSFQQCTDTCHVTHPGSGL